MERAAFSISGMHCASCVKHVGQALSAVAGVAIETIEVGSVKVSYDNAVVEKSTIVRALEEAGYRTEVRAPITSLEKRATGGHCCGCR